MKTIEPEQIADATSIAQIGADDNSGSVELLRTTGGKLVLRTNWGDGSDYYELDEVESEWATNPREYLEGEVREYLADNCEEPMRTLAAITWGLVDATDLAPADDATPCRVVRVGNCYGPCAPISYLTDDDGQTIEFASRSQAQERIDRETDYGDRGAYECLHNEAGAPSYYIVAAR